jgi:alginate O-acetyltransferase complex protein AlgI
MNFASLAFFVFLPVVLAGYFLLPTRAHKYRFLLAASWFFYMSWNPWFLWVILFTSVVDYAAALLIEAAPTAGRRKAWLLLSLITNMGFLAVFKYAHFFVDNGLTLARSMGWTVPDWTATIILPLGISFHTFQGISYTLDVYRGKITAVRSFTDFALFVAFFPQLVAGPIVRAVEFLPQMAIPPRPRTRQILEGGHLFLLGLFKKVFLADRLAQFVDPIFAHPGLYDGVTQRWAILAYAAQIYCDFSGYSDLASGCARWFGFELPCNFNLPYLASSITDFWKRWHISLSTWMRDYLYIPLGGNRRGPFRTHLNLILTMTLCGLWHGAHWNYVLWGFYNGVLLSLHRLYDRAVAGKSWVGRLRGHPAFGLLAILGTFVLVAAGLVMVRAQTWADCWLLETSLAGGGRELAALRWVPGWVPLLVGTVALGHLFGGLPRRRWDLLELPPLLRASAYVAAVVLLVVFGPGAGKAFIYFQF